MIVHLQFPTFALYNFNISIFAISMPTQAQAHVTAHKDVTCQQKSPLDISKRTLLTALSAKKTQKEAPKGCGTTGREIVCMCHIRVCAVCICAVCDSYTRHMYCGTKGREIVRSAHVKKVKTGNKVLRALIDGLPAQVAENLGQARILKESVPYCICSVKSMYADF